MVALNARHNWAAFATTVSNTTWTDVGELLMIFKISEVAVCCSHASFRSCSRRVTCGSSAAIEVRRSRVAFWHIATLWRGPLEDSRLSRFTPRTGTAFHCLPQAHDEAS